MSEDLFTYAAARRDTPPHQGHPRHRARMRGRRAEIAGRAARGADRREAGTMMTDDAASYAFAVRMLRLRGIITGEFWAHEDEPFDLVCAAMLARLG